jgi:hypothetical protein
MRRAHRRATVVLALGVGVIAAMVLSAWTYHRDAPATFRRWQADVQIPSVTVQGCPPEASEAYECFSEMVGRTLYDGIVAHPQVVSAELQGYAIVVATGGRTDRPFGLLVEARVAERGVIERWPLTAGRRPAVDAADEATVTTAVADAMGVGVGDELVLEVCGFDFAAEAPCSSSTVTVVGVVRSLWDLEPRRPPAPGTQDDLTAHPGIGVAAGWWQRHGQQLSSYLQVEAILAGDADPAAVARDLEGLPLRDVALTDNEDHRDVEALHEAVDLERSALASIAIVVAMLSTIVVASSFRRQIRAELGDLGAMQAIGAAPGLVVRAIVVRVAPIVVLSQGIALSLHLLLLRQAPPGLVGRMTIATTSVHVAASLATVTLVAVAVVAIGAHAAVGRLRPRRRLVRVSRVGLGAELLAPRVGLSLGVRAIWHNGSIIGSVAAVTVAVGATTFHTNINSVLDSPVGYGATWDYAVASTYNGELADAESVQQAIAAVHEADYITSAAVITRNDTAVVAGVPSLPSITFTPVKGSIGPTIVRGRVPSRADEVAVGPRTRVDLGIDIGDPLVIDDHEFTLVGEVMLSDDNPVVGPGRGLLFDASGAMLVTDVDYDINTLVVRTNHEMPSTSEIAELSDRFQGTVTIPAPPIDVGNLALVLGALRWASLLASIATVLTMAHWLAVVNDTNRRAFATLTALGFERNQLRVCIGSQGIVPTCGACVLGLPLGLVVARWITTSILRSIGIVVSPPTNVVAVVGVVVAISVATAVTLTWPAIRAARSPRRIVHVE